MSLFSKTEIQFLQGKKHVSKSYEYKLKSILKKKLSALFDKELPLLSPLFPDIDLTKFGKNLSIETNLQNLTNFGKVRKTLTEKRKLVAREGLEGSKSSTVNHKKNTVLLSLKT